MRSKVKGKQLQVEGESEIHIPSQKNIYAVTQGAF